MTHQLLVYADDVNPLDENIIWKNTETLQYVCIEAGRQAGRQAGRLAGWLAS
jgi:hypothetical protein